MDRESLENITEEELIEILHSLVDKGLLETWRSGEDGQEVFQITESGTKALKANLDQDKE